MSDRNELRIANRISSIAYRVSRLRSRITPYASRFLSPSSYSLPPSSFFLFPSSFFLLALLFLWRIALHPNGIPFTPRALYTDLLITHLPNAEYVRDSLARYGQLPLWQTQIMAGQPFAADPLAGLWYPPGLLVLVLPLPFAFNLLFVLHAAWAGYGLYGFLREEGLSIGAAWLGGAAFAGTPKLIAHIAAGHVSLVYAVAWTPWLLLALRRAVGDAAAPADGVKRGAVAGACLALIFLADVRWAFYAGAVGAGWWISHLPPFAPRRAGGPGARAALAFALFFLTLSAGLALPLYEFLLHSNRSALTVAEAGTHSLPPAYLLGLLVPDPFGYHEWMTYLGLVPLGLAFFGLRRREWFWGLTALLALFFSLGVNFPLFPFLFRVMPGLGFLRVPARAWFIVALGIAILAAHGAHRLAIAQHSCGTETLPRLPKRHRAASPWDAHTLIFSLLLIFTLADLLRVSSTILEVRPRPAPAPAAEWITAQAGLFRVYSPSYSLPQPDTLQHTDGVDPLHLAAYAEFMARASGLPLRGYSVTSPSYPEENSGVVGDSPDARLLGLLNVKYVAADFPLRSPGFTLAQTFDGTDVYENTLARPRAWTEPEASAVEIQSWSPNRIVVRAAGPGRLVLSEIMYPGWQAHVDGVRAPIETVEALLRGVSLSDGTHTVAFEFRPRWVYVGAVVTALGLLALIGVWRWAR